MSISQKVVDELGTPMFDINTVPEEDRERVLAMIPDPKYARFYVHRQIGGLWDFDLFDVAVEEYENVILVGDTGSSKTSVARAYAAYHRMPFYAVEGSESMDPGIVVGKTTTLPDGTFGWMDGKLSLVARYGGVILFDEVNMTLPRVMAAFKALISVSRWLDLPENGETILAGHGGHDHSTDDEGQTVCEGDPMPVFIMAAMNDRYVGTRRLNEATLNQFPIPLDWGYERSVEEELITSRRLIDLAERMRNLVEIRTPVSTNMLMEFEVHVERFNIDLAILFFVNKFASEERRPVRGALEAESAAILSELGGGDYEPLGDDVLAEATA